MLIKKFSNQLRQICRDPIEFQRGSPLPPTTATTLGAPHRKTHPCRFWPSKMCVLLLLLLVLFLLFLTAAWCWILCAVFLTVRVAFAAALALCCCFCCCCLFCCLCCCVAAVSKCAAACTNLLLFVVCVLPVLLFLLFFHLLLRCWDADRWKTHPCRFWLYNWLPLHCSQKKITGISKKKLEKPKNSLLLLLFVLLFFMSVLLLLLLLLLLLILLVRIHPFASDAGSSRGRVYSRQATERNCFKLPVSFGHEILTNFNNTHKSCFLAGFTHLTF